MVPIRPAVQVLGDELGSIVHLDAFRKTLYLRDALKHLDNVQSVDAAAGIEGETLTREVLDDDQHTDPVFIEELIRDEVHAPAHVP